MAQAGQQSGWAAVRLGSSQAGQQSGWAAVRLGSSEQVRALRPDFGGISDLFFGVVGPYPHSSPEQLEVRAFSVEGDLPPVEDPVTGSLNAGLAQWLLSAGLATAPYTAAQGLNMGRNGRVFISQDAAGQVWVGGAVHCIVSGQAAL